MDFVLNQEHVPAIVVIKLVVKNLNDYHLNQVHYMIIIMIVNCFVFFVVDINVSF